MARRRRLDVPSAEELAKLAEGIAAKPGDKPRPGLGMNVPPIARVAGEAAQQAAADSTEARVKAAQYEGDAKRYQAAQKAGLIAVQIPLEDIATDHLSRDRMAVDDDEMAELKHSIMAHGLRMPIEVLALEEGAEQPYGLISGWRRLAALRALSLETGKAEFGQIAALVRAPKDASDAYISMVEENEIRADLSQYERGRIAVIATAQGAFRDVESAVEALFAAGSKSKRSKIRSFALIFEELGDLLVYPTQMSERAGLRLAAALKAGQGQVFRHALAAETPDSFEAEWKLLEEPLKDFEAGQQRRKAERRAGKPQRHGVIELANGVKIEKINGPGYIDVRFTGKYADNEMVDLVMDHIQYLLEKE